MNNELFDRLLYEEESPTLDFKRDVRSRSESSSPKPSGQPNALR
jgi:hypothetical protein